MLFTIPMSAPGPDDIHYQILKDLPDPSLNVLLHIFNNIWDTGTFPDWWKEATIIPAARPGNYDTNPSNYKPLAQSCVCKTLERIINERLVWYLESSNLITSFQSGFRKKLRTLYHLVRLETFILEGFIKKEDVVFVFFDIEKAYDTTWKYVIMRDLHELGFQ